MAKGTRPEEIGEDDLADVVRGVFAAMDHVAQRQL